jgi:hypothetical protein
MNSPRSVSIDNDIPGNREKPRVHGSQRLWFILDEFGKHVLDYVIGVGVCINPTSHKCPQSFQKFG